MAMGILGPVGLLGPVGTHFCLSIAPIKSTDCILDLLSSTTIQYLGPLFKQTWRESK